MKAVIQRVRKASVIVGDERYAAINAGLLVLLGIDTDDTSEDAEWLCQKIAALRIFADEQGLMNRSVADTEGAVLVVSQFTLIASYKKGNRPSFIRAAKPQQAIPLYEYVIRRLEALLQKKVAHGIFGADMQVSLSNDGPVTIVMDTKNKE